jgi:hypothetical protein
MSNPLSGLRIGAFASLFFLSVALFAFPALTSSAGASPTGSAVKVADNSLGDQAGQTITFTATVTADNAAAGIPTGDVTWNVADGFGNAVPCKSTTQLFNGQATCTIAKADAGSYSATANYGGNGNCSASSGHDHSHQLGQASTQTSVTSDASGTLVGGSFAFTATVTGTGVSPTGIVSWAVTGPNGKPVTCASSTLNSSGQATCTITDSLAGSYSATASYKGDSNCASSWGKGKATVGPSHLIIHASSTSMVYGSTVPAITPSYSGFVNGDTPASLTTPPTCTTTANLSSPIGDYVTSCSGAVDSNYVITYAPGVLWVTPAPLVITASSPQVHVNGAVPTITPSYSGFVNGDTAASLNTPPTCATSYTQGAPASSGPWVTFCHGAVDSNYSITYVNGAVTICGSHVLVITASSSSVTYGSPVPTITYTTAPAVTLATPPVCTTSYTQGSPVTGTYTTSCSGAVAPGYTIIYWTGTVWVTPAPLVITASSGTIPYGSPVPTITPSYSGFVNGDTPASLTTPPTCVTTYTQGSPVGSTYPTSCSGAVDTNYSISYVPGVLCVTPAPLVITASSGTIPFGSPVPTITPSYSGFVNGDTPASLTTPPTCVTTYTQGSPVGSTYPTSCSGASDHNYVITYVPGILTVVPAPLTITASSATVPYLASVPTITPSYSGFVNGDTPVSLSTPPTCSTNYTQGAPVVGAYTTNCIGASDTNYAISYVPGTVTVTPLPLVITASSSTVTYGATPTVTASYTLPVGGSSLAGAPTCSTTATSTSPVGSYPSMCVGAVGTNYTISYVPGTVQITPVPTPLTVTASSSTFPQGTTPPQVTYTVTGFVGSNKTLTKTPACSTLATAASSAGTYPTSCTGAADTNYSGIKYVNGTDTVTSIAHPIALAGKTSVKKPSTKPKSATGTTTTTTPGPVAGATTVHTGEPWGGSGPWILAAAGVGLAMMALGGELFRRRRHS